MRLISCRGLRWEELFIGELFIGGLAIWCSHISRLVGLGLKGTISSPVILGL